MAWVRLDDGFTDHPKVIRAGEDAGWLFVAGLCYSGKHLTDGFIPEGKVDTLTRKRQPGKLADKLIEVGLWERVDGGYQVHDYLQWNPRGEVVKKKQEETRQRVAAWREKKKQERETSNNVTPPPSNADGNGVRNSVTGDVRN